jgi:hypothetical protein
MAKGKVNIIKATHELQRKVGSGPIDESVIKASQSLIENNEVDFAPVALVILDRLQDALKQAGNLANTLEDMKELLTRPVMELKANAAIFHYDLVGTLASIMLGFLENIKIMDRDAVEIVKAHHASLHVIVVRKITGDGGAIGESLISELKLACDRYYHKKFPDNSNP